MASDPDTPLRQALRSADPMAVFDTLIGIGQDGHLSMQEEVERFLGHDSPRLRGAAIRVLGFYWTVAEHRQTAERMWRTDPDEDVQAIALMAWGKYYDGTRDPAVLKTLLGLLNDISALEDLRAQAWPSLLAVAGVPRDQWPENVAVYGRIDELVDWSMVYEIEETLI